MTNEQLVASLTATATDIDALYLSDRQYIDWSTRDEDGKIQFELGNGDEAAAASLARDEMLALQQRLTLWLLRNPA